MAAGDIAALRLVGMQGGQRINHVFGFQDVDGSQTRQQLAEHFNATVLTTFMVGKSAQLGFTGIEVDDVLPGSGARVEFSITPAKVGNDSGSDPMPPKDALVITWRTDLKGRSYRGRTFETGRVEAGQSNGTWITSTLNLAFSFGELMMDTYGEDGTYGAWRFGIISRFLDKVKRAVPVITPVTGYAIRPTVYSQRRRTIGYGS